MQFKTMSVIIVVLAMIFITLISAVSYAQTETSQPPHITYSSTTLTLAPGYNTTLNFQVYNPNSEAKTLDYTLTNVPLYLTIDVFFTPSTTVPAKSYVYGSMIIHASKSAPSNINLNDISFTLFWKDDPLGRDISESLTLTVVIGANYDIKFYSDQNPIELTPFTEDGIFVSDISFDSNSLFTPSSPLMLISNSNVYTINYLSAEVISGSNYISNLYVKNAMILSAQDNAIGSLTAQRYVPFGFKLTTSQFPDNTQIQIKFTDNVYATSDLGISLTDLQNYQGDIDDIINDYPAPTSNPKFTTTYVLTIILHPAQQNIPSIIDFDIIYTGAHSLSGDTSDTTIIAQPGQTITIDFDIINKCDRELTVYVGWFLYKAIGLTNRDLPTDENGEILYDNIDPSQLEEVVDSYAPAQYSASGEYIEVKDQWVGSGIYTTNQNEKSVVMAVVIAPMSDTENSIVHLHLDLVPPVYANPDEQYVLSIVGVVLSPITQKRTLSLGIVHSDNFQPYDNITMTDSNSGILMPSNLSSIAGYVLLGIVIVAIATVMYLDYISKHKFKFGRKKL